MRNALSVDGDKRHTIAPKDIRDKNSAVPSFQSSFFSSFDTNSSPLLNALLGSYKPISCFSD